MVERRITHRLGKKVLDGSQLRSLPEIELPWITTFNLRWWHHAQKAGSRHTQKPRGTVGIPT